METIDSRREDAVLVLATADGDLAAVRELYDRHAPWLSARLMRGCNDWEAVVDVVQDTFLTIVGGRSEVARPG